MLRKTDSPHSTPLLNSRLPANSGLEVVYFKASLDVAPTSSLSIHTKSRGHNRSLDDQPESPSTDHVGEIRQVIAHLLDRCKIPFHVTPYDRQFHDACLGEAVRRGYPLDTPNAQGHTLRTFLPQGIIMSTTTYAHLKDEATRIYIAFYTALLIYLDDVFKDDVEVVSGFNERFIQKHPQGDPVLDALADLLRETSRHFGIVVSNIIIAATLNLITALPLEQESLHLNLPQSAHEFPSYIRVMTGAGEAFTLFAFPPEAPLHSYMHGIPDMRAFFNNGNDVLSFYKEEVGGESVNQISILAQCQQVPKIDVLRHIADSVADSHARLVEILGPQPAALETYLHFSRGYIGFHTSLKRYRLGELFHY